jgi:hypothetical protein
MKGYMGKLLRVNLATQRRIIRRESLVLIELPGGYGTRNRGRALFEEGCKL